LIRQAVETSGIPEDGTIVIGDDLRDLGAGRAAGLKVGLVCTGKGMQARDSLGEDALVFEDLVDAATRTVVRT
jgi:phosphoglycolate phosphatase-like HAD superfamily hydrolase